MRASGPGAGEPIRVAIVANTARCDVGRVRALVARERRATAAARLRVEWFPTSIDRPGEAARLAVERGAALVVAVGGDGIAHDVAGAVAARRLRATGGPGDEAAARGGADEPVLALVPVGTGNFLARGAGARVPFRRTSRTIARDVSRLLSAASPSTAADADGPRRAARTALAREARLDIAEIEAVRPDGARETAWFSVQAGFGWDAEALRRSPAVLKRDLRWGAYVVGLVRATLAARTLDRGGSIGGRRHEAVGVVASVGGALPLGVRVVPGSRTGDGRLGVALVQPRRALDWLGVVARTLASSWTPVRRPAPGAGERGTTAAAAGAADAGRPARGRRPSRPPLAYAARREIDLRFDAPTACELDGEPFGEVLAARLRVLPAPVRVLVV